METISERVATRHYELAKFCPVCGRELVVSKLGVPGMRDMTIDVKECPVGDSSLSYEVDEFGPMLQFGLNEELYKDSDKRPD